MSSTANSGNPPVGRRERNKHQKLERISTAARELFTRYGVDAVTTQQVADKADVGTGTVFLYAKTKGELLLLVQNSAYADALVRGKSAAEHIPDILDAVVAIIHPVVACNRAHIDNGRTYLREMVFGDPDEPYHREARSLAFQTEQVIAAVLQRNTSVTADQAAILAQVVSAIMFLILATDTNVEHSVEDIVEQIRAQVSLVLP